MKAAKEKAGYLAGAIDETIGSAVSINEGPEPNFEPMPVYRMGAQAYLSNAAYDKAGSGGADVDFKKIKLRFEVNAVFALK